MAIPSRLKSEKKHRSILLFLAIIAVAVFISIQLYTMNQEIIDKKTELQVINKELEDINLSNTQLEHYSCDENRMKYIEQIARDQLDYSYSDETVYYFIPK